MNNEEEVSIFRKIEETQKMFADAKTSPLILADLNYSVLELLKEIITNALFTDGGHHKQWYLAQMLKILDPIVTIEDEGIAP